MVRATLEDVRTPIQTRRQKLACNQVSSPSTPHRIELRSDSNSDDNNSKKAIAKPPQLVPKTKKRAKNELPSNQSALTEYFPVRRSVRRCQKTVLEEKQQMLEFAVRNGMEDGLQVKYFPGKGRGIVAAKDFCKGDFVVEYSGDLIDTISEAKEREKDYANDLNIGCYMYYFKFNDQQYCIDATAETGKLGRLVNHSRNGNLLTKVISIDNIPRLILMAKEDIRKGEEVLYDYGDRSKESLLNHPWLAN